MKTLDALCKARPRCRPCWPCGVGQHAAPKVVVIGGGFGGATLCAKKIDPKPT
jgi:hypothetical protein